MAALRMASLLLTALLAAVLVEARPHPGSDRDLKETAAAMWQKLKDKLQEVKEKLGLGRLEDYPVEPLVAALQEERVEEEEKDLYEEDRDLKKAMLKKLKKIKKQSIKGRAVSVPFDEEERREMDDLMANIKKSMGRVEATPLEEEDRGVMKKKGRADYEPFVDEENRREMDDLMAKIKKSMGRVEASSLDEEDRREMDDLMAKIKKSMGRVEAAPLEEEDRGVMKKKGRADYEPFEDEAERSAAQRNRRRRKKG